MKALEMQLPFIDLAAQQSRIRAPLEKAILNVLDDGKYIMGPQVAQLEKELADFCGAKHCLSCANGTDALQLALMALGVKAGDAVFVPSFTFAATAEVVAITGASPVFVDIRPDTLTIDPAHLLRTIENVTEKSKLKPKAIIAVDLFGQPANYPLLRTIADDYGLKLVADSAQGCGCTLHDHHPIFWADATTFSFFPAKPLGCYGDGGAILVKDGELRERLTSLRVHGQATAKDIEANGFTHDPKYLNLRLGITGRLDTLQAAVLLEKLRIFGDEIELRNQVADRYTSGLDGRVAATPTVIEGGRSVWAQYTIEHSNRDGLAAHLKAHGIPTAIYYPVPLHRQPVYSGYPSGPGGLPVSDEKIRKVISLPMSPYLDSGIQDQIIGAVREFR